MGGFAGGAIGWKLGWHFGYFAAFCVSTVLTGVGVFAAKWFVRRALS